MFSNVEEAKAREKGRNAEKQVSGILALMQSDEKTFNTLLKERGQADEFALLQSLMPEGTSAKAEFLKNEGMKELGFSDREISSGFADPMARQMVGAGATEPTGEAILRWGLDKKNQFDRRKKVSEAAFQTATEQFLGMGGTDDAFEKELATASPDLSDEERVYARAVRNQVFAGMEKKFPGLQTMVKKGFNTIASEEGTGTKFGGEVYASTDEFIDDLVKNTKPEDFGTVVAMFAATTQAHGQDVDGVMNSFARKWERGVTNLGGNAKNGYIRWLMGKFDPNAEGSVTVVNEEGTKTETSNFDIRRGIDFAGQIRNWRDATAKIRDDNWFIDGWVYGTAGSLPEMAAAFLPGGLPLVAMAQSERNMADLRRKHPNVDPGKFENGAMIAGGIYAALNKIGVDALFAKTPIFKNKLAQYTGLLAFETAVELAQDGSAPAVMKVYELADKEMPKINLFGEGGELTELIKQSPQIAWSMMPMVFLGVGGRAAVEYMDAKQLKTLLNDVNYLGQYGMSAEEAAKVKAMPLMEAADFIKNRGLPAITTDGGTTTFEFNADFSGQLANPAVEPFKSGDILFRPDTSGATMTSVADVVTAIREGKTDTPLSAVNDVVRESTELRERVRAESERRNAPRARGAAPILERIARERSAGTIGDAAAKALTEFINKLNPRFIEGDALSVRQKGNGGTYQFGEQLVTLFRGTEGVTAQTGVHEFWHGLSRYLTQKEFGQIESDYKRDLAAHIKENPGFLAFVGRYGLSQEQYDAYSKFASKEDLAQLEKLPRTNAEGHDYRIKFTSKNYRFVMVDEYFAEKMADLVLGKQKAPSGSTMGRMVELIKEFFTMIQAKLGKNVYESFYGEVMNPNSRIQQQRFGALKSPEQIYDPQRGSRMNDVRFSNTGDFEANAPAPAAPGVTVTFNPTSNTFSVSNESMTITARSPAEVAEVARQLAPQQFATPTVDRTIRFGDPEVETVNSFFGAMFSGSVGRLASEDPFRVAQGLPPVNDPNVNEGQQSYGAKLRYGLQGFFSSRTIPSKSLDKIRVVAERKAAGVENQFNQIALALDDRINRAVSALPRATQDAAAIQMRQDAYSALRGDAAALQALPAKVRTVVETGRTSIDAYSAALVSSNALSDELATSVGDNIGTYVTRQFRAFDPDARWNYATVKKQHPQVFQTALAEIMAGGLSATEADGVLRVMLDPARSQNFYAGTGKVGKVNISNLIKRKDLSPAILDVLGEIRNPAINIRETGKAVSKIVITNNAQNAMADWLLANGLASRTENTQNRQTERLGAESYSYAGIDPVTGDPMTGHGVRTSRAFAGFGTLYLEPELHAALTSVFEGGKKQDSKFLTAFDHLAKLTATGKFAQVILNPAAYPTNFLGGVATEIFNGRIGLDGIKAYGKFGSLRNVTEGAADPYGVVEQMAFYSMTGKAWLAGGGASSMNRNQLGTEMEQKGIRDASVFARDLSDTLDVAFGEKVAKVGRVLSKAYQATDNAVKRNAFVIELDKWARANPNETMDVLVQRAAEDVRATTQNYDMVPALLRQFSQRGIIVPTYISFAYELVRNTIGTSKLAGKELASGNPILMAAGIKRVAGMATVGAMLYGLNTVLSSTLAGLDDEEKKALKAAMPPWLEDSEVVFLQADDEKLRYFDPSYLIPHQMFYNAAAAAIHAGKKGDAAGAIIDPTTIILGSFGELNIFNATIAEAITNKKRGGGQIYNPEEPDQIKKSTDIAKHFSDSMFLPGFMRTINKVKKAEQHEVGFAGSTASMDDVWLGAFGIRPYTLDTGSEKFLVDNLIKFNSRTRDISGTMSERRRSTMTPDELAKGEAKLTTMRANLSAEVNATIRMFKQLGISDERIKAALKEAKTPKNLDIDFRKKTSTPAE